MKFTKLLLCFLVYSLSFSITAKTTQLKKSIFTVVNIYQKKITIFYKNNSLNIKGLNGNGNLKVYSIIGNIICDIDLQNLANLSLPIELIRQNMYIIRIQTSNNTIFTHKIIAQ